MPVAATGLSACYDESGVSRDCSGTGEDGEYTFGPVLTGDRFTSNNDGTVTDNLTGLIWLADASCDTLGASGTADWQTALDAANGLANGECGLSDGSSAGDWRLPNRNELASLLDLGQTAPSLPSGYGTYFSTTAVNDAYWTSSTVTAQEEYAWTVHMGSGAVINLIQKTPSVIYIWPVRGSM